ncbi:MAG: discoidin domain-containing protein [Candidatus Omnitrophica bacterium]|nr:discoidin domain-containing protein [Candidatus Omnitrophota bacterium]
MRKLLLVPLFVLSIISVGCSAQEPAQDNPQVYLKVDAVEVSSFDATPDWAPMPEARSLADGDLLTRWSSAYKDAQWLYFDFGKPKTFNKVVIFWEQAYAPDYDILVSNDKQNWKNVLSLKGQDGKIDEIEISPTKARYVKILGVKRANPDWGVSIWEVLFFGPAKDNPGDKALAEVYPAIADKMGNKNGAAGAEELEGPVASPGALTDKEFQKGVVYTSWSSVELGTPASDQTLEYLYNLGVREVGIMVVWYQDEVDAKSIYRDQKDTPTDATLVHAINKAHSLGMKVMLKPHADVKTGQWRGDIIPSAEWFASYKDYMIYYAKLAALYNVEFFSVGTELVNTTTKNWQGQWEGIIDQIREVFPGPLTYSANWNEYTDVGFWDKLDYVGIDAYFPLTSDKDPSKEELIGAWKANADIIDAWLKKGKINKPVVFTEVGYCSADGTNIQPWTVYANLTDGMVDQQEQMDCLDAMLTVCTTYPWFKGIYWWNYFPKVTWSPLGYPIRGKKAEETFSEWLKKI